MRKNLLLCLFLLSGVYCRAQLSQTDTLLADIVSSIEAPVLLPEKMIFTQRALWGNHGLVRIWRPLTIENRRQEFKIRRTMFKFHQAAGLATFLGMMAQGFVGGKLYNNYSDQLKHTHQKLALGVNIGYTTTALMSLTAPPAIVHRKGFSSAKLHRGLAMLHLTGMVLTNVLVRQIRQHPELKPYHRAAAYTTVTAFTISILSFKLK
ncbi:MAG: hypothetical protein R2822_15200 [Spirosomataceae bacterium]